MCACVCVCVCVCAGELIFDPVDTDEPLTDELLGVLLRIGSRVRTLICPSLVLQSDQHAKTPWPWERLTCPTFDLGQLHRLPELRKGQRVTVCVRELIVGADTAQVSCVVPIHTHTHIHAVPTLKT